MDYVVRTCNGDSSDGQVQGLRDVSSGSPEVPLPCVVGGFKPPFRFLRPSIACTTVSAVEWIDLQNTMFDIALFCKIY